MSIKAAKITVDLEARSAKFSQALDRAARDTSKFQSGFLRELDKVQRASEAFEQRVSKAIMEPFRKFEKAVAPFLIAVRKIQASLENVMRPFVKLAEYISGPFVRAFNKASSAIRAFTGILSKIGTASAATVAALLYIGSQAAATSLEINRLANMCGITYKQMNQLSYAAKLAGVSTEQLADGMKDLTAKIQDAAKAGTGALVPFFTMTNQKVEEWQKLNPEEQLLRFADTLSKMDYQSALYWADEVNGSMAELAPLLHKGAEYFEMLRKEADMFGASIDGIDKLKEVEQVFSRIKFAARNAFTGIGIALAPTLMQAFDTAMLKFKKYLEDKGAGDAAEGFKTVVKEFSSELLWCIGEMMSGISSAMETVKSLFNSLLDGYNWLLEKKGGAVKLKAGARDSATEDQKLDLKIHDNIVDANAKAQAQTKADEYEFKKLDEWVKERKSYYNMMFGDAKFAYSDEDKAMFNKRDAAEDKYQQSKRISDDLKAALEQNTDGYNLLVNTINAQHDNQVYQQSQTAYPLHDELNDKFKAVRDAKTPEQAKQLFTELEAFIKNAKDKGINISIPDQAKFGSLNVKYGDAFKPSEDTQQKLDASKATQQKFDANNAAFMKVAGGGDALEPAMLRVQELEDKSVKTAQEAADKKVSITEKYNQKRAEIAALYAKQIADYEVMFKPADDADQDKKAAYEKSLQEKKAAIAERQKLALAGIAIEEKAEQEKADAEAKREQEKIQRAKTAAENQVKAQQQAAKALEIQNIQDQRARMEAEQANDMLLLREQHSTQQAQLQANEHHTQQQIDALLAAQQAEIKATEEHNKLALQELDKRLKAEADKKEKARVAEIKKKADAATAELVAAQKAAFNETQKKIKALEAAREQETKLNKRFIGYQRQYGIQRVDALREAQAIELQEFEKHAAERLAVAEQLYGKNSPELELIIKQDQRVREELLKDQANERSKTDFSNLNPFAGVDLSTADGLADALENVWHWDNKLTEAQREILLSGDDQISMFLRLSAGLNDVADVMFNMDLASVWQDITTAINGAVDAIGNLVSGSTSFGDFMSQLGDAFAFDNISESLTNMNQGIFDAYSERQSMIQGFSNQELDDILLNEQEKVALREQGGTALADAEAKSQAGQKKMLVAGGAQILEQMAQHDERAFKLNKAMKIADTIMNTYAGASKALAEGGPVMGPALAAMMTAQGMIQVNMIRQQEWKGQAHDGIDYVPNTGTWNLETGERVIDKRTNHDLKTYLGNANKQQQQAPQYTVHAPVTVQGNVTDEAWANRLFADHRDALVYQLRQASSSAGGLF
ncbi:hypothetical protein [Vibrio cholerae]|uniref:hypothetical protein n=1 Tax=Vibrio cholerae TaxID=666 RepID=UPI00353094E9